MVPDLEELDRLISKNRPELHAALLPGITQETLDSELGELLAPTPDTLKELWRWHNGQDQSYCGDFHSRTNEMLMSVEDAIEVRSEHNDLVEAGEISSQNWRSDLLPFTENGGGNYMCVSLTSGEVVYYDKYGTSTGVRFASTREWLDDLVDGYRDL